MLLYLACRVISGNLSICKLDTTQRERRKESLIEYSPSELRFSIFLECNWLFFQLKAFDYIYNSRPYEIMAARIYFVTHVRNAQSAYIFFFICHLQSRCRPTLVILVSVMSTVLFK